jgi:hypothetical protein
MWILKFSGLNSYQRIRQNFKNSITRDQTITIPPDLFLSLSQRGLYRFLRIVASDVTTLVENNPDSHSSPHPFNITRVRMWARFI